MRSYGLAAVLLSASAAAQSAHTASIWIQGPDEVHANSTYTLEVWGSWDSAVFVDGVSAFAGFGIDARATQGTDNIASMGGVQVAGWAAGFGTDGITLGYTIVGTSGGQLANLFGILNPNINMGNPLLLYSFEFTTNSDPITVLEFEPFNPNPNGGLSFYPVSTDGASIIAPNDAGTDLVLTPWRYEVPTPASAIVLAAAFWSRRRR